MRVWPALEIAQRPTPNSQRPTPTDTRRDPTWELEVGDWELIQAKLVDFDVAAIDDNAPDLWRVFFRTAEERDRAAKALREEFRGLSVAPIDVPDENWAARSQRDLTAVRVGNVIVAPPWDIGASGLDTAPIIKPIVTIVIEPSMGFGTGHHATTRLCLAHLQRLDLRQRTVIDVGCGSAVLAIAASRLGAIHVLAIDEDPDAIQSARENVALNAGVEVTLGVLDLRRTTLRRFDVVLANLTGGLLSSRMPMRFSAR